MATLKPLQISRWITRLASGSKPGLGTARFRQVSFACVGVVMVVGSLMLAIVPEAKPKVTLPEPNQRCTIVLDAGHGGYDLGARAANGLYEKNLTLDIASRVESRLKTRGFSVISTRKTDRFVKLSERAQIGNATSNAIFVSIHCNDAENAQANGVETYFSNSKGEAVSLAPWRAYGFFTLSEAATDPQGHALAGHIHAALTQNLQAYDRGVRNRAFYVVRNVFRPSVLVECGFLSNPVEAQLFTIPGYRDRIAEAITEGIVSFERERTGSGAKPPQLASINPTGSEVPRSD